MTPPLTKLERSIRSAVADLEVADLTPRRDALRGYAASRAAVGLSRRPGIFVSGGSDIAKLGEGIGLPAYGLALAPHSLSGSNVCPWSTVSCRRSCVAYSGMGTAPSVLAGRLARTHFLVNDPVGFVSLLVSELDRIVGTEGEISMRLNAFSDIRWELMLPRWFWGRFSSVRFYDYTKASVGRRPNLPANYALTHSVSDKTSPSYIAAAIGAGRSVAVVIPTRGGKTADGTKRPIPADYHKLGTVVDGDLNDRRYADPAGSLVVLRRKGTLRADSPMVWTADRLATALDNDGK